MSEQLDAIRARLKEYEGLEARAKEAFAFRGRDVYASEMERVIEARHTLEILCDKDLRALLDQVDELREALRLVGADAETASKAVFNYAPHDRGEVAASWFRQIAARAHALLEAQR